MLAGYVSLETMINIQNREKNLKENEWLTVRSGQVQEVNNDNTAMVQISGFPADAPILADIQNGIILSGGENCIVQFPEGNRQRPIVTAKFDLQIPPEEEVDINPYETPPEPTELHYLIGSHSTARTMGRWSLADNIIDVTADFNSVMGSTTVQGVASNGEIVILINDNFTPAFSGGNYSNFLFKCNVDGTGVEKVK